MASPGFMMLNSHGDGVMPSLPILDHGSILTDPFCDYLNVTTPEEHSEAVMSALAPLLDMLGGEEESPGLYRFAGIFGTFKNHRRGNVAVLGASGGVLDLLRRRHLFQDYLSILASFPHRVSMLHATCDYRAQGSAVVHQVKAAGQAGRLYLTRKAIQPKQVVFFFSQGIDGLDTGTVYLGSKKNADVWGKVYDKQHERLCRGFPDPGAMVRVEIAVQSDVGATLKDASNPTSLFYHFAGRSLVEVPSGVPAWQAHGEGFQITPRSHDWTAAERIDSIFSSDSGIARALALATEDSQGDTEKALELVLWRFKVQARNRLKGAVSGGEVASA